MRVIIQRVSDASVTVEGKTVGKTEKGFLVLLGVTFDDTEKHAEVLAKKVANLRVFTDENDKMNLSMIDVNGSALVVSNFTLYADCSHGRRPSFINAARPEQAEKLYEYFVECLKNEGVKSVETGVFGADMKVSLTNDGPITILIDTNDLKIQ